MEFTFFEINGDPLSANRLTIGTQGTAVVTDDAADGFLESGNSDSGSQFSIDGVDFTTTAWPDYTSTGSNVEIYSATIFGPGGGGTITFAYLTAAGDGEDDAVDRIVILSGSISTGQRIRNIDLIDGDSAVEYETIPSIIICFTPGTLITTPRGQVPVEHLQVDDLVITADHGLQAIRWIGRKRMTGARLQAYPELRPIRIRKGALGNDLPNRDMWVSPQHRMLVSSERTALYHGESEVLAPAKGLLNDLSITVDYGLSTTEYIHILFDNHEIIFANGSATESFHPGENSILGLDEEPREELFEIFPELESSPTIYGPSARLSLKVKEAQRLHRPERTRVRRPSFQL